ncbi:MAG: hypothetical protein A2004_09085 [Spirochaetes bacterium GWC1_61_12]|nr:MAG: hypothetical protein A2004_09085 [Spirochaetes bacterium GWC1_61_12]OHD59162.1 MAG: hypothetical protein A2Y32_14860 [Spirochaetes bacterium GWF1_60_12]
MSTSSFQHQLFGRTLALVVFLINFSISSNVAVAQESEYSINDLVLRAISNSYEIEAERASLGLRHGAWRLAFRSLLPEISFDAMGDERLVLDGQDNFSKSMGVSLNQTLWDGGRLLMSRMFEEQDISLALVGLRRKEQALGDSVVQALRSLIATRQRIEIRQRSLDMARQQLSLMQIESNLGLTLASDINEAEIKIASLELELDNNLLDLRLAELELTSLLGMESVPAVSESFDLESSRVEVEADLYISMVLARSVDLIAQRQAIQKKLAEIRVYNWSWMPTVSLKATMRVSGASYPLTEFNWNVGLSLDFSLPFLNSTLGVSGGQDGNDISTMRSSAQIDPLANPAAMLTPQSQLLAISIEQEKLQQMIVSLRRQAQAALERYAIVWQRRQLAAREMALAQTRLAFMQLELSLGKKTRLELLSASLALSEKQLALIDSHLAVLNAERELEKMAEIETGGLALYCAGEEL